MANKEYIEKEEKELWRRFEAAKEKTRKVLEDVTGERKIKLWDAAEAAKKKGLAVGSQEFWDEIGKHVGEGKELEFAREHYGRVSNMKWQMDNEIEGTGLPWTKDEFQGLNDGIGKAAAKGFKVGSDEFWQVMMSECGRGGRRLEEIKLQYWRIHEEVDCAIM